MTAPDLHPADQITSRRNQAHRPEGEEKQHPQGTKRHRNLVREQTLVKHIPQTIFTSHESISSSRSRNQKLLSSSKYHTHSNHSKYDYNQGQKMKTTGSSEIVRKDIRVYFNDSTIQKHFKDEHKLLNLWHSNNETKEANTSIDFSEDNDSSYQCTSL